MCRYAPSFGLSLTISSNSSFYVVIGFSVHRYDRWAATYNSRVGYYALIMCYISKIPLSWHHSANDYVCKKHDPEKDGSTYECILTIIGIGVIVEDSND